MISPYFTFRCRTGLRFKSCPTVVVPGQLKCFDSSVVRPFEMDHRVSWVSAGRLGHPNFVGEMIELTVRHGRQNIERFQAAACTDSVGARESVVVAALTVPAAMQD